MTKKELHDSEEGNYGMVYLYHDGKFWNAYERSAYILCTQVRPLKPTTDEITILNNNATSEWIVDYDGTGINGRLFTSTVAGEEGHSIFFPATGYGKDSNSLSSSGTVGNFWARNVKPDRPSDAYGLFTSKTDGSKTDASQRYHGFPVRAVLE